MISNYLKNICLIIFALVGPISLPAGGIQSSIYTNLNVDNSNEIIESNAMTLSTVENNAPSSRVVLLK